MDQFITNCTPRQRTLIVLVGILVSLLIVGQLFATERDKQDNRSLFVLTASRTEASMKIDGLLDEPVWETTPVSRAFQNQWPVDTGRAALQTEVRLAYDGDYLYISAVCYDNGQPVIQNLRRDADFWGSDGFSVALDPVNERTNGFLFAVNAGGAQSEALLPMSGNSQNAWSWDTKWYSEVQRLADRWVVEIAIPFRSLRYEASKTEWGVNFVRNDMKNNYYSTWSPVPLQFGAVDMGFTGTLQLQDSPDKARRNVVLIPYLTGGRSRNQEDGEPTSHDLDVGMDAKIAITSSLNLDLTVNPDFSNVDVDQQQTNLSRFSLFFPERRNFFLENSDLFSSFGNWNVRPFFSRRIGLNDGEPVPVKYGLRLTGNVTKDIRLGVMDVQTAATDELAAQNYAVVSVSKRILKRSAITAMWVNRQAFAEGERLRNDYNSVGGLEFRYLSQDGRWAANAKYHLSTTEEKLDQNRFLTSTINYNSRYIESGFRYTQVGQNFIADVGFVPRLNNYDPVQDTTVRIGYESYNPWFLYTFRPGHSPVNSHGPRTWGVLTFNPDGSFNELNYNLHYAINFQNTSSLRIGYRKNIVDLPFGVDFVDDAEPIPAQRYDYNTGIVRYSSDSRKRFSYSAEVNYGTFYSGTRLFSSIDFNYRRQPWGNIGMRYVLNQIAFDDPYGAATLHLVGPRVEIAFNNQLFWTSFFQYNTQAENFNINSRLQWRYKPMSDLFIVYSDNYATENFRVKNRGIVFKLTYWLNV